MMNWEKIRQLYISACGEAEAAVAEWPIHLYEGYSTVCTRVESRELERVNESIYTQAGVDWIPLPTDLFAILDLYNATLGQRIHPDEGGWKGRTQYMEPDTSMPPQAPPNRYALSGVRIYLRPTPDQSYQMRVRYKARPDQVTDANLDQRPVTPPELDMAIVQAAALSFFSTHPKSDVALEGQGSSADKLRGSLEMKFNTQAEPKTIERRDIDNRIRIPGFNMRFRR